MRVEPNVNIPKISNHMWFFQSSISKYHQHLPFWIFLYVVQQDCIIEDMYYWMSNRIKFRSTSCKGKVFKSMWWVVILCGVSYTLTAQVISFGLKSFFLSLHLSSMKHAWHLIPTWRIPSEHTPQISFLFFCISTTLQHGEWFLLKLLKTTIAILIMLEY